MKFTLTLPLSLAVTLFVGRVVDMHCLYFLTFHSSHSVLASAPTVSSEMLHQVHQWAPYFKTFKGHFLPFYWTTLGYLAMEVTLLFEIFSAFGTCGSLHHLSWPPRAPHSQIGWPNGTPWVQGVSFTLFNYTYYIIYYIYYIIYIYIYIYTAIYMLITSRLTSLQKSWLLAPLLKVSEAF